MSELLPLADWIRTLSPFDHDVWANLEAHAEAAWTRRALAGHWPSFTRHTGEVLELVCRPNLDLHTGVAGWYCQRHGNLHRRPAGGARRRIRARRVVLRGAVVWSRSAALGRRAGRPAWRLRRAGGPLHTDSVRSLWLDRAGGRSRAGPQGGAPPVRAEGQHGPGRPRPTGAGDAAVSTPKGAVAFTVIAFE
jgi:hypothetical protein